MRLKLQFLGTGPAVAIPREGCGDEVCRAARRGGKSRRTRSSALVALGRTTILIDAGPDVLEQLSRARVKRLDAVLLTHGHADAAGGLRDLDKWAGKNFTGTRLSILTDQYTLFRLKKKYPALANLELIAIKAYKKFSLGQVSFIPFSVRHSVTPGFPTFGFYFGQRLAYASDAIRIPPRSFSLLKNTKTLVLDAAKFRGKSMAMHFSSDEAIRTASKLRVKNLILTQIGHSYPPHEKAESEIQKFLQDSAYKCPKRVILAYDSFQRIFSLH